MSAKRFPLISIQAWPRPKEMLAGIWFWKSNYPKFDSKFCYQNFFYDIFGLVNIMTKFDFATQTLNYNRPKWRNFKYNSTLVKHSQHEPGVICGSSSGSRLVSLLDSQQIQTIPVDYNSCLRDGPRNYGVEKGSLHPVFKAKCRCFLVIWFWDCLCSWPLHGWLKLGKLINMAWILFELSVTVEWIVIVCVC